MSLPSPAVITARGWTSAWLACGLMAVATVAGAGPALAPPVTTQTAAGTQADPRAAAIYRGARVYAAYCATCHGVDADGRGRAAHLHNPRPANLRTSDKNDAYIALIVQRGGQVLGRSPAMPPWSEELATEQISDVVAYLRSLNIRSLNARP